jgi:hypothetical protein
MSSMGGAGIDPTVNSKATDAENNKDSDATKLAEMIRPAMTAIDQGLDAQLSVMGKMTDATQALLDYLHIKAPTAADAGYTPSGAAGSGVTGSGAPMGYGGAAAAATPAPGGSTVGGRGDARMPRPQSAGASPGGPEWFDQAAEYAKGKLSGMRFGGSTAANSMMKYLMGQGMTDDEAAAVIANASRESSLDPTASNGSHYGLFQFDEGRQADFKRVMGKDIHGTSWQDQLTYMHKSILPGGEEATQAASFYAANGADAKAAAFSNDIERTDHAGREAEIRAETARALRDGYNDKIPAKDAAAAAAAQANATPRGVTHPSYVNPLGQHQGVTLNLTQTINAAGPNGIKSAKVIKTSTPLPVNMGGMPTTIPGN